MKNKIKKSLYKEDLQMQIVGHVILIILTLFALIPFVILVSSSFSAQEVIIKEGYSLIPKRIDFEAYNYLWKQSDQIFRAYGITILVTAIGTTANVFITSLIAYPLSRKDLPARNVFSIFVLITMLFNGGLVPTYLWYTHYLGIKNTLFALLVPRILTTAWYILLMRTFFMNNIPRDVIESAQIDGLNELGVYWKIVLPLGKIIVATVGLFAGIMYWNDWYNGMIYLTDAKLFSIQNLLQRMLADIQFLANNASTIGNSAELAAQIPSTTVRMAIAVVGVVPIMCIYPFVQNNFVKGINIGAVKG
jgi:putative aldouronate transport system permease protein